MREESHVPDDALLTALTDETLRSILEEVPSFSAYLCEIKEVDRRGSNPRPSEPQSADICF